MWTKLYPSSGPEVAIKKTGRIVFNDAACLLMGNPPKLALFYDSETNQLGFRPKHSFDAEDLEGFCIVKASDPGECAIDAREHLQAHLLLPADNLTVTLHEPVQVVDEEEVDYGIYWCQLE